MKKKLITGLLAASLIMTPLLLPTTVAADTLEDMRQEKEKLEQENNNIQNNINVQEETLKTLAEEKATLENNVVDLQLDIDKVVRELNEQEQKLKAAEEKVVQLQKEIEELKELIAQREEKINNQARAVQTDGNTSNIMNIIISAESLSDLLGRIGIVNELVDANQEIVTAQIEDQKALETKEAEAEAERVAIETLKGEIEMNRNTLMSQKDELDKKIVEIAAHYDMTEEQKNAFVKEQEVIASKTSTLSAEMKAEQDRIIAEQRAQEEKERKELEERERVAAEEAAAAAKKAESNKVATTSSSSNDSSSSNPNSTKSSSGFIRPSGGYTTSPYGYRFHPIEHTNKLHGGMDFGGGGAIVAAQGGTVNTAQYNSGWGWYVKINHGNGLETLYAHMQPGSLRVSVGQTVSQGQQVGTMGTSGSSTGIHLHFEVYNNGVRTDPAPYLGM